MAQAVAFAQPMPLHWQAHEGVSECCSTPLPGLRACCELGRGARVFQDAMAGRLPTAMGSANLTWRTQSHQRRSQ